MASASSFINTYYLTAVRCDSCTFAALCMTFAALCMTLHLLLLLLLLCDVTVAAPHLAAMSAMSTIVLRMVA